MFLFNANTKLNTKLATHFCKKLLDLRYLAKASVMSKEIKEISPIKSKFWEAAVRGWIDLKNCIKVDERNENLENYADSIAAEPLFYNNLVKYRNKPLWIERWIRGGVRYMGQLCHNNRYLIVQEVAQRIGHYAGIY